MNLELDTVVCNNFAQLGVQFFIQEICTSNNIKKLKKKSVFYTYKIKKS